MYRTLCVANQFAGQGFVEYLCDLAVGWRADDDHPGSAFIGELGDTTPGVAMPADDPEQVTGPRDAGRVEEVNVGSDDATGCVESLSVSGELLDDIGFDDVEDFNRPVEQSSELNGGACDR
jgi:hypothetical protein